MNVTDGITIILTLIQSSCFSQSYSFLKCLCSSQFSSCTFMYEKRNAVNFMVNHVGQGEVSEESKHSVFVCDMPQGNSFEVTCRRNPVEFYACDANTTCRFSHLKISTDIKCPSSCVVLAWPGYEHEVTYTYVIGDMEKERGNCDSTLTTSISTGVTTPISVDPGISSVTVNSTTQTILSSTLPPTDHRDPTVTIAVVVACILFAVLICGLAALVICMKNRRKPNNKEEQPDNAATSTNQDGADVKEPNVYSRLNNGRKEAPQEVSRSLLEQYDLKNFMNVSPQPSDTNREPRQTLVATSTNRDATHAATDHVKNKHYYNYVDIKDVHPPDPECCGDGHDMNNDENEESHPEHRAKVTSSVKDDDAYTAYNSISSGDAYYTIPNYKSTSSEPKPGYSRVHCGPSNSHHNLNAAGSGCVINNKSHQRLHQPDKVMTSTNQDGADVKEPNVYSRLDNGRKEAPQEVSRSLLEQYDLKNVLNVSPQPSDSNREPEQNSVAKSINRDTTYTATGHVKGFYYKLEPDH